VYLETDPGIPEIEVAKGDRYTIDFLNAHTHHFTFGENIGRPGRALPINGYRYQPTRQPVVLDWWRGGGYSDIDGKNSDVPFTTVSTWQQSTDITWMGRYTRGAKTASF